MTKLDIRNRISQSLEGLKARELRDVLEYIENMKATQEILADEAAMKRLAEAEADWNNGKPKPGTYFKWDEVREDA